MLPSLPESAALILIDVQQGMDDPVWGHRNNPHAEENMAALLVAWRRTGRPIFHIQHLSVYPDSPLRPGQPGVDIKPLVRPQGDEPVINKHVNSAFIGTDLEAQLRAAGIDTLVFVGLTTDHCVSTTTRMAGNLGFKAYVVEDATATFDRVGYDNRVYPAEEIHTVTLVSLNEEFATVVKTAHLLARLD